MSDEKNTALFNALIHSFQLQTMIQLGKIKNPMTDTIERDLSQAEISIDMIEMLKAKTAGNLTEPETRFIDAILAELKMNYVDEKNKDASKPAEAKPTDEENK